jgi:hypothetical protein
MSKAESVQSHKEHRAQWRAAVDEARESGQGPRQFCQERGLDLARFYYWRRVFALEGIEENPEARFALVRRGTPAKEAGGDAGLELHRGFAPGGDQRGRVERASGGAGSAERKTAKTLCRAAATKCLKP